MEGPQKKKNNLLGVSTENLKLFSNSRPATHLLQDHVKNIQKSILCLNFVQSRKMRS